jgi:hypothetical protein
VRHRTIRSKGCLSNGTALAMVFKLLEGAQKSWRRLDGHNQLPKLVLGVTFADGIEVIAKPTVSPEPPPPDRPGRHQKLAIAPGACGWPTRPLWRGQPGLAERPRWSKKASERRLQTSLGQRSSGLLSWHRKARTRVHDAA